MPRTRGRPPGESGAREGILAEAGRQFGELGYRRTTLRSVARGAGVDHRLVGHYFGSKEELFRQSVRLPLDADRIVTQVVEGTRDEIGARAAALVLGILEEPAGRAALMGMLRAATSEPEVAHLVRDVLVERLLGPIATRLGGDRPALRATLVASQLVGLAVARHVVALPPLVAASPETVRDALAPVLQHYLTADLTGGDGA